MQSYKFYIKHVITAAAVFMNMHIDMCVLWPGAHCTINISVKVNLMTNMSTIFLWKNIWSQGNFSHVQNAIVISLIIKQIREIKTEIEYEISSNFHKWGARQVYELQ